MDVFLWNVAVWLSINSHLWRVCLRLCGITFDRDSNNSRWEPKENLQKNWEFPCLVNFCALDSARRGIALAMNVFNWSTYPQTPQTLWNLGVVCVFKMGKVLNQFLHWKQIFSLESEKCMCKFNNKKLGRCGNFGICTLDYSWALWTTSPSSACLGRDNFHKRLLLVEAAIGTVQSMALRTKWLWPWKNWPIGFSWKKAFK